MSRIRRLAAWPDTGGRTIRDRFGCTCRHFRLDHRRTVGYDTDACERCECRRFTLSLARPR